MSRALAIDDYTVETCYDAQRNRSAYRRNRGLNDKTADLKNMFYVRP